MPFPTTGVRLVPSGLPSAKFVCRQCLGQQSQTVPSRILQSLRQSRRHATTTTTTTMTPTSASTTRRPVLSPTFFSMTTTKTTTATTRNTSAGSHAAMISTTTTTTTTTTQAIAGHQLSKRAFPGTTSSKSVAYWLLGSAASVFGIVVFGGLTRLTESGLSITEWKPVTGSLPPLTQQHWESEFEKYRASPEFKMLNSHMDLAEFKKIYFMEWTHRLWGRLIGLSFVLPTAYFIARRRVSMRMAWSLVGISGLIGFQGFIGWWMVRSGLTDDLFAPGSHPRVSQYRLTAHLATAFVCYSWMLLAGLSILRTRRLLANPADSMKLVEALRHPAMVPFRRSVAALTALVFTTVLSGALVAGLDAGLIYNEFPKMGLGLTPPASELWDKFYSRREDGSDLWWRNMLENPSLVQLDHRILATTTFCSVLALFVYVRRGRVAAILPKDTRKGVTGLVHLVSLQAALGISTLIYMVPIPLAAAHQAGALALLTGALVLGQRLRIPNSTLRLIQKKSAAMPKQ
ncbi:cytochrome c oxidase assembly protein COX15 [Xylaria sp. FL0933]|nr:cytochrome c oxidase assembly protein COX15 [Xylaria sp. FL0933]